MEDICLRCYPPKKRSTCKEGYSKDHRKASEWLRRVRPLCERCVMEYGAVLANTSKHLHHIEKIAHRPDLRMERSNWLAVCIGCHETLEDDVPAARKIKEWSEANYDKALRISCQEENLQLKQ